MAALNVDDSEEARKLIYLSVRKRAGGNAPRCIFTLFFFFFLPLSDVIKCFGGGVPMITRGLEAVLFAPDRFHMCEISGLLHAYGVRKQWS